MTKAELITNVANGADVTKKEASAVVEAVFETIEEILVSGDKIQIPGFGVFETKERAARVGRNPQTGAAIDIPASTVPVFKASKVLKDAVNE